MFRFSTRLLSPQYFPWTATVLVLLWLLGQILRDVNVVSGLLFYLPSPALAALLLSLTVAFVVRRHPRQAAFFGCLTLLPLASVVLVENRWTTERTIESHDPQDEELSFVHWNMFRGFLGQRGPLAIVAELAPDVGVLSEVPRRAEAAAVAAFLGKGYQVGRLGPIMMAICRGELQIHQVEREKAIDLGCFTCRTAGEDLKIVAADIVANPLVPRDLPLDRLRSWLELYEPDLTAGDFNSPRRSRRLWPLPHGYSHAYVAAGRGWSYTWPVPLPMLAIDQCIVGKRVVPRSYELRSTRYSDHRLQLLRFRVAERPESFR